MDSGVRGGRRGWWTLCGAVLLLVGVGFDDLAAQSRSGPALRTGLAVDVREVRYRLDLVNFSEVIDSMNAMRLEGPRFPRSQGLTTYRLEPHWWYQPNDEGCAVTEVVVDVDIEVTLPHWVQAASAPDEHRERWTEVLRFVREHEYEHRDISIAVGGDLLNDLLFLRAGTCTGLRRAAENTITLATARLDEAHAALDGR